MIYACGLRVAFFCPIAYSFGKRYLNVKLAVILNISSIAMVDETTGASGSEESIEINNKDAEFSSGIAAFEAKNFKQAMQFLLPLAYDGDAESQHRCAIMYQNGLGSVANEDKAFEFMYSAANQGHPVAQHGLGFMYMEGECTQKSPQDAVKWFTKAGEQGLVGSLTTLAMMYQEGNGVEKNLDEARRLYKEAGFDDMQVE